MMRVAVCCKGVPVDLTLESTKITHGDVRYENAEIYINEFDAYALEAALCLEKTYGTETTVLTLGPLRAQEVLYIAIAKGINKVLRIDGETSRPELIAAGLAPALKEIDPQIILVGVQSEDWMGGEVGIYLSQILNLSVAYAVVEICELSDAGIRVRKEMGGGRTAEVLLSLPAVLCVQSGIQPLRYLSMMKRKKARENPIKLWGKLEIDTVKQALSGVMDYEVREVSVPSTEGHAEMITGDRAEKVSKLLGIIDSTV
jgi:electron transfer flavoprotein beta subunit